MPARFYLMNWGANYFPIIPVGIYLLKAKNRNTRTRCKVCSKLTIKILVSFWCLYYINFEQISHPVLVFLLLTLNKYLQAGFSLNINLIPSLPVTRCVGHNTDLLSTYFPAYRKLFKDYSLSFLMISILIDFALVLL